MSAVNTGQNIEMDRETVGNDNNFATSFNWLGHRKAKNKSVLLKEHFTNFQ